MGAAVGSKVGFPVRSYSLLQPRLNNTHLGLVLGSFVGKK